MAVTLDLMNATTTFISQLTTNTNEHFTTTQASPPSVADDTNIYARFVYQRNIHVDPIAKVILVIFFIVSMAWGNIGNIAVMGAILVHRKLRHNVANTFIFNLAIADLCVTSFVDASYVIGNLDAGIFFRYPKFCTAAASICIISCTCSMWSITIISFNRYIYITKSTIYPVIFTRKNSLFMAAGLWLLCFCIDFLNHVGLGDHIFDHKKLGCSFDRLGHYGYTVYFILLGVATPLCLVLFSYTSIFVFVRDHQRKIQAWREEAQGEENPKKIGDLKLLKTVFIIFVVFLTCWTPYTVIVLSDIRDIYPYEVYVCAIILAHANSSMNSILYGVTNTQFRLGYKMLLRKITCGYLYARTSDLESTSKADRSNAPGTGTTTTRREGNSTTITHVVT